MIAPGTWIMIGLVGQTCFFLRFVVQWVASERAGRSVVPGVFWHLSIAGSLVILAYALWRRDPVFIVAQSMGLLVYFRNLVLIWREERQDPGDRGSRISDRAQV